VARGSYISPAVFEGFARGRVIGACLGPRDVVGLSPPGGLHAAERALATFLRAATPRPALRPVRGGSRGPGRASRPTGSTAKPLRRAARRPE
jgi:hypothetical protein